MFRIGGLILAATVLVGCVAPAPRGSIPVTEASAPRSSGVMNNSASRVTQSAPQPAAPAVRDAGVVVNVPEEFRSAPIQTFPANGSSAPINPAANSVVTEMPLASSPTTPFVVQPPAQPSSYTSPPTSSGFSVSRIPAPAPTPSPVVTANSGLAGDEQLDGPVLALLTSAQQMERGGNLSGASASLERAQRIAPREPQILYRLAEVRLAQGDAPQAEQLARRALSYSTGRATLQAGLWDVIARAREKQGDAAGAAEARQRTKVAL